MSTHHRDNPDSEECQRLDYENRRDVFAAQMQHKMSTTKPMSTDNEPSEAAKAAVLKLIHYIAHAPTAALSDERIDEHKPVFQEIVQRALTAHGAALQSRLEAVENERDEAQAVARILGEEVVKLRRQVGWWNCQCHGETGEQCQCGAATAFVTFKQERDSHRKNGEGARLMMEDARRQRDAALAQLAQTKDDTARLDWFGGEVTTAMAFNPRSGFYWFLAHNRDTTQGANLRAAVDTAMKKETDSAPGRADRTPSTGEL